MARYSGHMEGNYKMIAIITAIASKLPLALAEKWLAYLIKRDDNDTVRMRDTLTSIIEARKLQATVIISEQGWWLTAMIRPLIAWPIIIYVWKVVVWDTVLGLGSTPILQGSVGEWSGIIITAYFVGRPIEKGVAALINGRK